MKDVIRFVSKKGLKEFVPYSPQHIDRLEKAGRFPKRVKLGPGRVAWVLSEIEDWIQGIVAKRDAKTAS
ncbi:AlpA family phage regulatory protein [Mesorhizobium sp. B1-1-5]|uniref:helix-turn-helix transcriptional regulator n=1 Tax=Mesorhizobium sp. B1-1-5 TaxID=2589979 RepID=UPI001126191F|nr:AlpA family phage regulatory protein [Mesorhizobium sp. B1-1-5]TPO01487.1 AlpA family phage regulatory protein [Mesorhizobium sp. B1-1-5]